MTNLDICIKQFDKITPDLRDDMETLYQGVFGMPINQDGDLEAFNRAVKPVLLIIYNNINEPMAFKMGYARNEERFYSWMGGCMPNFRNKGLASLAMKEQHKICKNNGYKFVETKCRPDRVEMLKLNDKFGFKLVKEYKNERGEIRYILEKEL